jgi:hypothetical protein
MALAAGMSMRIRQKGLFPILRKLSTVDVLHFIALGSAREAGLKQERPPPTACCARRWRWPRTGYEYQFIFVRNAGHADHTVQAQTLPSGDRVSHAELQAGQ